MKGIFSGSGSKAWLNFNGKFIEEKTAVVRADNRALRYGDGLFETIKVVLGKIRHRDLHFERLFRGMDILQIRLNGYVTADTLEEQIQQTLSKNKISGPARVRLMVFRGNGGLYDFGTHGAGYIIQAWPLSSSTLSMSSEGLTLGVYEEGRKACDALSGIKSNNFLVYAMAALEARRNGWDDCLVLNTRGRVCDASIANVFWVKDNAIFTPPLSEGGVAGVMRQYLIGRLGEEGYAFSEKEATIEELKQADEIFLTNAISGIRWVKTFGDRQYGNSVATRVFNATI